MAFPEGDRSSKLEVCGANIPLEDALLASAGGTNDSSPSPMNPLSEKGLLLVTKHRKQWIMKTPIPHPHSNTHIPEVRTTQNTTRPRGSPEFHEPLSAYASTFFLWFGMPQHKMKPSLTFSLFKLSKFLNLSNCNTKLWKTSTSENSSYSNVWGLIIDLMIFWIKRKRHAWINGNLLKSLIYMCLFFLIHTGSCSRAVLSSKLEGVTMPCSPQCVMSLCSDLLISAKLEGGHPPQRRPQKCVMQIRMPLGRFCWQSLHTVLKLFQPRQKTPGPKLITCRRGGGGAMFYSQNGDHPHLPLPHFPPQPVLKPSKWHDCPTSSFQNNCHLPEPWISHLHTEYPGARKL